MRGRRRHTVEVEVEISEFDDDVVLEEARQIAMRRGLPEHFEGSGEDAYYRIVDLASAIARGDPAEALRRLDDIVSDDPRLREAVDIGRRKR